MQWVETTGRTIEEAKDAALDELGVDEQDAEFEVLEEPKQGLFGRLRSEARVRARVRPTAPRAKEERRGRSRAKGRDGRDDRTQHDARPDGATDEAPAARSDRRPAAKKATRPPRGDRTERPARPANEEREMTELTLTEQASIAEGFLRGLVERMGLEADAEVVEVDEDTVEVRLRGDQLGLLIGPGGKTLDAVQELARTAVQHRAEGARNGRLLVDVGGYRERRREALARFTQQIAAEVKEAGAPRSMEPMTPADRKVVHDTVNGIEGVTTTSEGEEPRRRVVLHPDS